ncbi:helix-turn-helix domain-containing protein [Sphingomonas echinoides]|uniref:helix-turn-helix domain-containing protein n=1 Tax=Sphingomonas echinoides TaxID=59803 RepID=UPI003EEF57BE
MARGIHDSRYRWVIERLVEARKKLGLSQQAVAQRLGKPQQYVSRYETGERRLDIFEYLDVAKVLSIDGLALAREGSTQIG